MSASRAEPLLQVAEERDPELAHADVLRRGELLADRGGRQRGGGVRIGRVALDHRDRAGKAEIVGEEIGDRGADRGPADDHHVVGFGTHPCLPCMQPNSGMRDAWRLGLCRRRNRELPMTIRPRRSVLYMPGSNARALEKAKTLAGGRRDPRPGGRGRARRQGGGARAGGGRREGRRVRRARGVHPHQRLRHAVVCRRSDGRDRRRARRDPDPEGLDRRISSS